MQFAEYLSRLQQVHETVGERLKMADPCSVAVLDAFEADLAMVVPEELRKAWLTADGSARDAVVFANPGCLTGYAFLSVAASRITRERLRNAAPQYAGAKYVEPRRRDRRLRSGWFHEGWLPFADFGNGSLLLLVDCATSWRGLPGQVISFTHDPDEMGYVSGSFDDFLKASIAMIEAEPEELLACY